MIPSTDRSQSYKIKPQREATQWSKNHFSKQVLLYKMYWIEKEDRNIFSNWRGIKLVICHCVRIFGFISFCSNMLGIRLSRKLGKGMKFRNILRRKKHCLYFYNKFRLLWLYGLRLTLKQEGWINIWWYLLTCAHPLREDRPIVTTYKHVYFLFWKNFPTALKPVSNCSCYKY